MWRATGTLAALLAIASGGFGGAGPARASAADAPHCVAPPFVPEGGLRGRGAVPPAVARGGGRALVPGTGSVHLLVILAEFADKPARVPAARFPDHLFGAGLSMATYYADASEGALAMTGDVHGWVGLPQTAAYYAGGSGGAGVGPYPNNGQRMAEDAVQAALNDGLDLDGYDADGDGVVDALLVIHSGQGWEWASSSALTPEPDPYAINSHKWVVRQEDFGVGTRVEDYFTCPELLIPRFNVAPGWTDSIATIGVYCHEFGHMLGLPDFYDTQTFENRVGVWDLMDYGTWNRITGDPSRVAPGVLPGLFSGWSRAWLGWEDPLTVGASPGQTETVPLDLEPVSGGGGAVHLGGNPLGVDWAPGSPGSGEFFVAEARARTGWDEGLPAEGMLIYHVDESRPTNRASDSPNGGGLLVLVPEDGDFDLGTRAGDPWPGTQTSFGPLSSPSSARFDGSESGVSVDGITAGAGGTASATFNVRNLEVPVPLPYASPNPWFPARDGSVALRLSIDGPVASSARVTVYDLLGRRVRVLGSGDLGPEDRVALWDGRGEGGAPVPAGVYFFRAEGGVSGTGKVLLLR
jgi:immune inhibitor A